VVGNGDAPCQQSNWTAAATARTTRRAKEGKGFYSEQTTINNGLYKRTPPSLECSGHSGKCVRG
jgi:hypothetical protein